MEGLWHLVNPWQLPLPLWIGGVIAKESALQVMDLGVRIMSNHIEPLPSRKGPKPVVQRALDRMDFFYLACNAVVETVFIGHLVHYLWHSDRVDRSLSSFGVLNGPVALWLLIIFNDMLYAPFHRALHHPMLYRWIHKHHHRITYPQRGNIDARNEHPLEQIMAMSLWYAATRMVTALTGLHGAVIVAHISVMVIFACFNHTGCDLKFNVLGLDFAVRAHEMHHRRPDTNFGQLVMWFDRLMGTYVPYAMNQD
mmetsp:Transcript_67139/g.187886  ORF Transcript_67139/g.187886 Transcript_67139/m.187886 type:complete len:253 (-) Transcript_67139:338-1096(-)